MGRWGINAPKRPAVHRPANVGQAHIKATVQGRALASGNLDHVAGADAQLFDRSIGLQEYVHCRLLFGVCYFTPLK
jgi:hypothetical protein